MQLVARIVATSRALRLGRQARQIEAAIATLTAPQREALATLTQKEMTNAGRAEFPHLYGSAPDKLRQAWGEGAEIGFERVRSDNPQVRMRGIALWIAVVYHETESLQHLGSAGLHKHVLRLLRLVKEAAPSRAEIDAEWNTGRGEAA